MRVTRFSSGFENSIVSMSERKVEDVFTQICVLLERYPEIIPLTNAWIMEKTVQSPKARKRASLLVWLGCIKSKGASITVADSTGPWSRQHDEASVGVELPPLPQAATGI